jgi:hypothetical protein
MQKGAAIKYENTKAETLLRPKMAAWLEELAADESRLYGKYHLRWCQEWRDGVPLRERGVWIAVHVETGKRAGSDGVVEPGETYEEARDRSKVTLMAWLDANG